MQREITTGTLATALAITLLGIWSTLLYDEYAVRRQLEAETTASGCTLLEKFKPNPGGQTRFFERFPLDDISDQETRWQLLCGGIGCIAGETQINGIPVQELTQAPIKVQTLTGEQWATPAFVKGQANLYRVTMRSGKSILVTVHHRMLSLTGWHRLQDLGCGAIVACHDNGGGLHDLEISKGYQGRYQEHFHCDDGLPHPALIFALEQVGLLSWLHNDIPCNPSLRSTGSSSQESLLQHAAFERLFAQVAFGLLHHQPHNPSQFPDRFHPLDIEQLFHSLEACKNSYAGQHPFCLDLTQIPYKLLQQLILLLRNVVPFAHNFAFADNARQWIDSSVFERLDLPSSHTNHVLQAGVSRFHGLLQDVLQLLDCFYNHAITGTSHLLRTDESSYFWSDLISGNINHSNSYWDVIEAIEYVRYDDFYDLHVPVGNHYLANEIWHHNSGKSYSGAAWACSRAVLAPDARGLITANNFGQLSRATLITLAEVCRDFDIPLDPWKGSVEDTALAIANRQRCYIGEERTFVYVLSLNSFMGSVQAARGLQIRWAWIDEGSYSSEKAFQTLDGRLGRGPGTLKGQGLITTSPNGFNWVYNRFADPNRSDEFRRIYIMFSCSTRENVAALGEDYVSSLEANYTDELAAQELEGAFINTVQGRAYKYFNRAKHALQGEEAEIIAYDQNLDLHVSFDFNYSPAVCVLAQQRGNEVHFFQEFYMLDSDTFELASLVTEAIDQANHQAEIYVYGDASGSARTAVSRQSNWDIVFEAFKSIGYHTGKFGRLHRRFEKSNPPVKNRINSCNCLFKADRVYVDLNQAPELVKDWEMLGFSQRGDRVDVDKTDPLRSHLSDAAGYLLHTLYPFKKAAIELRKDKPKGIAA